MACEITITNVVVTAADGGDVVRVNITGTAEDCKRIAVTLKCGVSELPAAADVVAGLWSVEIADTGCKCGDLLVVDAVCEEDETCRATTFNGTLDCPQACPEISVTVAVGNCNDNDGTHTVTFTTNIAAGDDVVAHWEFEPGEFSAPIIVDAGDEVEVEHAYPYTAPGAPAPELIIDLPEGCPSIRPDVPELEPCPIECPEIRDITIGVSEDCDRAEGTRDVTLNAVIVGDGVQSYHWEFDDGSEQTINAPETPEITHAYTAPGNMDSEYLVTLTIVGPGECIDTRVERVVVPGCGEQCPEITEVIVESGECTANGLERTMRFDARIEGEGVTEFLWDFGNGASERIQGANPATSQDYVAPGSYNATLTISGPEGCESSANVEVNVAACEERNGGEGWGCLASRWAIIILTIMASLALWIAICVPGAAPVWFWIAAGLALAALIVTALWLASCPQPCGWGLLLAWQVALGVGIGALYFANCCPWLWAIGGGLIALAIALFTAWVLECRPTLCEVAAELGMVISVVIIPVLGWLVNIPLLAACMNPIVAAAVGALGLAVAFVLVRCARAGH